MRRAPAGTDVLDYRELLGALTAFKRGDFSVRMPVDRTGMAGKISDTLNEIFELNDRMLKEFERISRVVGKEGKINQRATIGIDRGGWSNCVEFVNGLIGDLVQPSTEVARIIGAVARGDLSQKMPLQVDGRTLKGEFQRTARVVNTMVDQLNSFASEVTRVAREVGTEGKLGGQAQVKGVAGVWKDLTDNVNSMAGSLTAQVRNIAAVTTAVAKGDLSQKITVDVRGEILELKNTINTLVDQLNSFASEVTRVAREVGTEGKLGGQAEVKGVAGVWKDLTDSVNSMAGNLTAQVRNIAAVTTAVAKGDLSRKITVDVRGEILELKNTINTMVDQLNSFASEVTRVAREVGTEGKLGGQAEVPGIAGVWKDLTDNVNSMAANLTTQVRGIAKVVTAVANGDLKRKLVLETKGEIAELAETINEMIDTLAVFADQVTTVAREVGVEGKLGGQARVPGAAGIWRDLTNNLNQLAATLTGQVRAIAEVATAVTKGDLTRSISVEAQGEVAALKDNINEMILNLRETTRKNTEQDWLKTNVARFTRMLQGQRDLLAVSKMVLSELAPLVGARQGVFYVCDTSGKEPVLKLLSSYAYKQRKGLFNEFRLGESLVGQCALEKERILLTNAPQEYITISSGLGEAAPVNIVVLPVLFEGDVKAVVELASFDKFSEIHLAFLDQLTESIGIVLNTIEATMRTEQLLQQSQALANELQARQEELTQGNRRLEEQARTLHASEDLLRKQQEQLRQTNAELQEKAQLLAEQKTEVEQKNREVEQAKMALEEKAEQLFLTSKYKSEFLANMSHELRTPLNTLLILSKVLCENADGRMTPKEVRMIETIHSCGSELLLLINDILDLSKIESGMMTVELGDVPFSELQEYLERTFRHVTEAKGLKFEVLRDPELPASIHTDGKRLQQVVRNLVSNAVKFTESGSVTIEIRPASSGWSEEEETLNQAGQVVAFAVRDTGIGIPQNKQKVIFEAFRQADGTTSRKYGGTGLGLSICREIARLLGGEIRLESEEGKGSVFTLYLPQTYAAPKPASKRDQPPSSASGNGLHSIGARERSAVLVPETTESASPVRAALDDDRQNIAAGDRLVLIIENDSGIARAAVDAARKKGFKAIAALRGREGLALARETAPHAVFLDLNLPDISGWTVLDRLRADPQTRQIPVHVTASEASGLRGVTYLMGPGSRANWERALALVESTANGKIRELLVVDPRDEAKRELAELLPADRLSATLASSGREALGALRQGCFDCVVIGSAPSDMGSFELIEKMRGGSEGAAAPIVVFQEEDWAEPRQMQEITVSAKPAGDIFEEAVGFLEFASSRLAKSENETTVPARPPRLEISGAKILIVDDDVRNLFALTSALERHGIEVLPAESAKAGIDVLQKTPGVDLVLMDVMMPEMDGYEAIRLIRHMDAFRFVPIVALTAKALKGDRERCIEAGASDYISKPVDIEELMWLLRAWLPRTRPSSVPV
jgi:signal transduction histidine kinase/CheY-like chemotaxis protein/HAMP domain-containing protein